MALCKLATLDHAEIIHQFHLLHHKSNPNQFNPDNEGAGEVCRQACMKQS